MRLSRNGCSVCALSSLCFVFLFVVLVFCGKFGALVGFSDPKSDQFAVRMVELQMKNETSSDHEFRAIQLPERSNSITDFHVQRLRSSNDDSQNRSLARKTFTRLKANQKLEHGLARARAAIRQAASARNLTSTAVVDKNFVPTRAVYSNPGAFFRSYVEMEKRFKVYIYEEGDPPMVHDGPCKDIYSIEGRLIYEIERNGSRFRTRDWQRAHVYFLPFSVTWMVKYLYEADSYDVTPLRKFVADYVRVISTKYPFWNRTQGADHFMLSCHDWGPHATQGNPLLFNTSTRVLCNANTSEGFNPQKDVSLPEIHLIGGNIPRKLSSPPRPDSPRPYLAFFAGGLHGPIRPSLLRHWKNDGELRVFEYLPKGGKGGGLDYYGHMLRSRFCLCPSGYEVASPRIVEAIYSECVPVILSEHYVLPFSDVLRWEAFSVRVDVSDIPRLKEVLGGIGREEYGRLKEGVRAVRRHFVLNQPARRYDAFHMILHSVWLRRINVRFN